LIDISIVLINLTIPWLGKLIIDQGFPQRDWNLVLQVVLGIGCLTGFVYGLSALRTTLYNMAEMLVGLDIRKRMYAHLQKLSLDSVESIPVGQQQFRVTTDADRIAHMLVRILPTGIMLVEFVLILTAAVYVDPILTGIVLCFLVPWTVLFIWVTQYGRTYDRRRLRLAEMRDSAILQDASSFATIKSYARRRMMVRRNGQLNLGVQRVAAQGYLILVGFEFITQKLLPYVKATLIYVYLIRKVVFGQMTLGMTVPLIAYLSRLAFPIERIVNFGCWIWQTMVSAERLMQILTTEPSISNKSGSLRLDHVHGEVSIEGVSLERPGIGLVLDNVSVNLAPGRTVAIVGPSGAGKSSLLGLVLRFHDPVSGSIKIDGNRLTKLDLPTYLRQVGTVTQDTFIFRGTLAENLRLSHPEASDDDIWRVLDTVGLAQWAGLLTNKIDQDLEGGLGLSAGQRQRIGIARAMISEPRILLLDEPTSALDAETERQISRLLRTVAADRAVMLVTHRLDTVVHADEIVVLNRGKLVERGTHEELLAERGLYAELFSLHRSIEKSADEMVRI